MHWTGWALHTLRQAVEIDMRCKRMTERQQERAHLCPGQGHMLPIEAAAGVNRLIEGIAVG